MEMDLELKKVYRINIIIGASVIGGIFVLALLVEVLKSELTPFLGFSRISNIRNLRLTFYGLGIIQVIIIRFLQPVLYKLKPGQTPSQILMRLNSAAVLTYALAEVPALAGFALFMLRGLSGDFYIFFGISLILEAMYFPRLRNWEEVLRRSRFPSGD